MSLPALPEIFGNYVLGQFNEVVAPEPVSWLPQTPGWYVVAGVLLVFTLRRAWRRLRYWHRNRYRKEAVQRLRDLPASDNPTAAINRVLKLSALAAYRREQVASLSGQEWASFLNAACEQPPFDPGQCDLLALGAYTVTPLDEGARQGLLTASVAWLEQHRNRFGD